MMKTNSLRAKARTLLLGTSTLIVLSIVPAVAQPVPGQLQFNANFVTPNALLAGAPFASDTVEAISAANTANATLTGDTQTVMKDLIALQTVANGLTPQQQQVLSKPDSATQTLIQQAQTVQYYSATAAAMTDPGLSSLYTAVADSMNAAFVTNAQAAGADPTVIAKMATAVTAGTQLAMVTGNLFADQINAINANGKVQQLEGRDLQNMATNIQNGTIPVAISAKQMIVSGGLEATLSQGLVDISKLNSAQLSVLGIKLITNDGATLITNDGATLITNDGATLITNDGATLITNDGATFVKLSGLNTGQMAQLAAAGTVLTTTGADLGTVVAASAFATSQLISEDGSGLISEDGSGLAAKLISEDGSGFIAKLISEGGNGIISNNGNALVNPNGAGLVTINGTDVVSNDGGSVISHNGSAIVSEHGYGLLAVDKPPQQQPPNSPPSRFSTAEQLAKGSPSTSSPSPSPSIPASPSTSALSSPSTAQSQPADSSKLSPSAQASRLPRDLSKLSDQQLMTLENQYCARVATAQQNGSSAADVAQLKLNMDRLYLQQYTNDQASASKVGNAAGAKGYQQSIDALKQAIQTVAAALPPPDNSRYTFAELTAAAQGAAPNTHSPQFTTAGTALVAALLNGRQTPVTVTADPSKPYAGLTPAQVLFVASSNLKPSDQAELSQVISKYQNGTISAADLSNPAFVTAYNSLLTAIPAQQQREVAKGLELHDQGR